jgi:hypothetical protein
MEYYWIEFSDRGRGCIDAKSKEEALELAAKHGSDAKIMGTLPYPASPRLEQQNACPNFCYTPNECVGRKCCPKQHRSCSS